MSTPQTAVQSYQNFFVKTVSRSLGTAYDSITNAPDVTNDLADRGLAALDMALKPQIGPAVWDQTKELLLTLSPKMEQAGRWEQWYPYLEKSLAMSTTQSDQQAEGAVQLQVGIFRQRRGQFNEAIGCFEHAITCAKAVEDESLWASGLNRLGFVASQQHRMTEASNYIEQAFELMTEDDTQRELSYSVLGMMSIGLREYQQAVQYFQQSLEICQKNGDKHQIAVRLDNVGVSLHFQGSSQAALEKLDESAKILEEINAPIQLAITRMNQGIAYRSLGDHQTALLYYAETKPILEKALNTFNLASLYNNQGVCYYHLQRWQEAEELFQVSLLEWQHLENWVNYANTLDGVGMVYYNQGRLEEAVETFKNALQILSDKTDRDVSHHLSQEIAEHLEDTYIQLAK